MLMSRSRAWVINQAVERYLDYEEWFVGEVKHALKQVEAGEVLEPQRGGEEVGAKACGWTGLETPLATSIRSRSTLGATTLKPRFEPSQKSFDK